MWGRNPTCALLLQVIALCAVGGCVYMLVAISEAAMRRYKWSTSPVCNCAFPSVAELKQQMQTIHRAIKRKSLHLRRATHGKTNSLPSLVQASDTVQTQVLKRERINRFKREIDKIRGDWLSALRGALGCNCPDQLHLALSPHLQPISPGAHLSSSGKVQT